MLVEEPNKRKGAERGLVFNPRDKTIPPSREFAQTIKNSPMKRSYKNPKRLIKFLTPLNLMFMKKRHFGAEYWRY